MIRSAVLFLVLVLLPTAALSVFAFRAAEQDYREGLQAQRVRLEEEAAALARRVEGAVADAARKAGDEEVVGYASEGEWLGYTPRAGGEEDPAGAAPEEIRYCRLSLRGGESYEFSRKDPARALDAYSFYLPRIHSPFLRARLAFRMARAAFSLGEEALGRALASKLLQAGPPGAIEDGLPVPLLAALLLKDPGEVRRALREHQRDLSTAALARLAGDFAPEDAALTRLVERRRSLEAAVAADPAILASRDVLLREDRLLLARPSSAGGSRAIVCEPVELPPLSGGGFEGRLEDAAGGSAPEAGEPGAAGQADPAAAQTAGTPGGTIAAPAAASGAEATARAIRLGAGGPELAALVVRDPGAAARAAALRERRDLQRALLGLLVLLTLGGGAALLRYLVRERRLAELRARLLANVSHELKTPVTSIRMFSEMLAEDPLDPERTRRFGRLLSAEGLRLSQLVTSLLDFQKAGREEQVLEIEPVELGALLRQVVASFSFRAREKGGECILLEPPELAVMTSAGAVERILQNLLDNALKYRREEPPRIEVKVEPSAEEVRVTVSDNGRGIPRRDRERVFEEFYRVRYDDYAVQGSGLGLAIARRLARKLGGDLTVASREGAGSRFTLVLPRGPA